MSFLFQILKQFDKETSVPSGFKSPDEGENHDNQEVTTTILRGYHNNGQQ